MFINGDRVILAPLDRPDLLSVKQVMVSATLGGVRTERTPLMTGTRVISLKINAIVNRFRGKKTPARYRKQLRRLYRSV